MEKFRSLGRSRNSLACAAATLAMVGQPIAAVAGAEDDMPTKEINQISVRPLDTLVGDAVVEYERRLADRWSLLVVPKGLFGTHKFDGLALGKRAWTRRGADIEVGVRLFSAETALRGFFLNPSLAFRAVHFACGTDAAGRLLGIRGRVKAGYQWFFDSGLSLNLAGGLEISWVRGDFDYPGGLGTLAGTLLDSIALSAKEARRLRPNFSLGIGYAF